MDLAQLVYRLTAGFPRAEQFGVSAQMRRAAVSIPSNIAEGHRHRRPGYAHYVVVALGSHAELETQALLAERLKFIETAEMTQFHELATDVGQLAHGLLRSLEPPQ